MDEAVAATAAVLATVPTARPQKKRLLVCCDGTWMNSDKGYKKTGFLIPVIKAQVPSNVTRISRSFKRQCSDGTVQIIEYQSGVGTGSSMSDIVTGGAFGFGIAENIREVYAFICANYVDGDEIVLIGFSRGAFTARSVAGMIGDLGLLTREGMDHFYPIFKDMENWRTEGYRDPFPNNPFPSKPRGENAEEAYRAMLLQKGYTRVHERSGKLITVKAVAVWDTVGSLGIPRVSWLQKLGIQRSTKEYPCTFRFYDTALSDRIEHAFQALALDEHRPQFSPAVWERLPQNKSTTDLRQVWFPGNHGNVGGGWADAGIANMSLAWIMDQLASVGVEFDKGSIERLFATATQYYRIAAYRGEKPSDTLPRPISSSAGKGLAPPAQRRTSTLRAWLAGLLHPKRLLEWAASPIYQNNHPVRVWGLGAILRASSPIYVLAGKITRTPGVYRKVDPLTGQPAEAFLEDTNERVHPSVRVRLAARGLGLDDRGLWDYPALQKNGWQLRRTREQFYDPVPPAPEGAAPGGAAPAAAAADADAAASPEYRYVWVYTGPEDGAPPQRTLVEEPLGQYEQKLLQLAAGQPNVYDFAEEWCRQMVPEV